MLLAPEAQPRGAQCSQRDLCGPLSDFGCRQKRKTLFVKSSHNINIITTTTTTTKDNFSASKGALKIQRRRTHHPVSQ